MFVLLQTALDLLEDEMDVWVVVDACASRSERNRDAAFDRLAGAGVELGYDRDGSCLNGCEVRSIHNSKWSKH